MPLSQADRIAFSLQIVGSDAQVSGLQTAKTQLQTQLDKLTSLDLANKNLFDPVNAMVNFYQAEYNSIDGNLRTSIVEQDIQDSANKILQNHFFPNDTSMVVPSLSASHNIWTKVKPFALTYGIGKNYTETYGSITGEIPSITASLGLITSASGNTDIQNTSGQMCNGTPPDNIVAYTAVQTLKTNLVTVISSMVTALNAELVALNAIIDTDPTRTSQNTAAKNNISSVILPALNTWLAYPDFNTSHGQTTCAGFNSYDSSLLAPTKLHSVQLNALQAALNTRNTFLATRTPQLQANLGTIVQDLSTGELTSSSGFYGTRYNYLVLRLNALGGSLSQLVSLQASSSAQDSMVSSIQSSKSTYSAILPTSLLKAAGNGTPSITLVDTTAFSPGDTVYIVADSQDELQRAIKSISNGTIVLNDVVPSKYVPASNARIYKDLS